jgi:hypothetical protein
LADIPRMIPWNHANASILPGFKEMVRSGIFLAAAKARGRELGFSGKVLAEERR